MKRHGLPTLRLLPKVDKDGKCVGCKTTPTKDGDCPCAKEK